MLALPELATEVAPQDVRLDPMRLGRLDRYLDSYVASGRHKASLIVISRGGRIAHLSMRGYRDEVLGLPVEADTIWRILSMTKPLISVAAMILYEEGALSVFDPVARFIRSSACECTGRDRRQPRPAHPPPSRCSPRTC
jgi:CubicO group peptidase (beta-lactamase class C family)